MAFRPLTEAECGQANPLSKLTSHITRDHTFSDNHGQVFQNSSDQLVEQFLQESRAVPQTYRMDDLMREMHEIESQRSALPPIPASTVKDQLHDNAWALQYIEDGKRFNDVYNNENVWAEIISQEQREYGIQAVANTWTNEILNNPLGQTDSFLPEDALDDNSQYVYSKFMKFMKEEGNGTIEEGKLTEREATDWTKEYFDEEEQQNKSPEAVAQKWSEEHQQAQSSKDDEFNSEFWNKLQEEFKKVSETEIDPAQPWIDEFNSYYNTNTKEYEFSDENPMMEIPKPLERGKEFLDQGDFPSAVLCFEAAVKQEPENVEAWLLLGTTQAENEQDPSAISALNKCLQLEPTNLKALMALAVSYTNESYYNQACQMLLNWLKYNSKYQELIPPNFKLSGADHKAIQDLYIKAAQRNPQHVDYEVQCGLGVLFNLTLTIL